MKQLILLFFKVALDSLANESNNRDDSMLMGVITTPLGKIEGIRSSQLALIPIPYIAQTGKVGQVRMKKLYLDQVLDKLAGDLRVNRVALIDGGRGIVIVANIDLATEEECIPCYYGSTVNPINMANLQHLEANIVRCLDEGLEYLPSDQLHKWINVVLNPIFEQAKMVISAKD